MGQYEKKQRQLAEKHAAAAGRARHETAGQVNMGLVRSGVQDYVRHMGTPTMHIIDLADRGGMDHGQLKKDFHVPAFALEMLPVYRAQAPAVRKDFSLDMPRQARQQMVQAFADYTGVTLPTAPAAN